MATQKLTVNLSIEADRIPDDIDEIALESLSLDSIVRAIECELTIELENPILTFETVKLRRF